MNLPFISVVVATLNNADTLQRCLAGYASQGYRHRELIVADGGSTDGTVELLERNRDQIHYWKSGADASIYDAWNQVLDQCRGQWICFLGADDYFWSSDALQALAEAAQSVYPPIRVVYGRCMVVSPGGCPIEVLGDPWETAGRRFRQVMSIPQPGTLHHRSLFETHGRFDTHFRIAADYELLLRELKSGDAVYVPKVICGFTLGGISSKPNYMLKSLLEVRRAQRKQGVPLGFRWVAALYRALVRISLWAALGERNARVLLDAGRKIQGKPPYWTKAG